MIARSFYEVLSLTILHICCVFKKTDVGALYLSPKEK